MVSVCLFVSRITQKLLNQFSQNSVERYVAHGTRKKPLDFGGNPDHVMLGLPFASGLGYKWVKHYTPHDRVIDSVALIRTFHSAFV